LDSFVTLTPIAIPTVNTISYNASAFDAVITGNVTADGGAAVTQRGIVFSTSGLPDLNSSKGIAGSAGTGTFSVNLTGLNASTKYYFRGFATNSAGTGYGALDSFSTVGFFPPVTYAVNLIGASSITTTSAICSGEVIENSVFQFGPPSPPIAERGIVYATSGFPTISNNKVLASGFAGTGTFDVNLAELTSSTKYYYRAYAIITSGSSAMYSRLDSFVTLTPIAIPTVNTISYNASAFDAVITGNVTADGGAAVTQRGIVFSTSGLPDLNSSKGIAGSAGTGTFSVNLTGLNASTKYYFRGFATNSAGTGYGALDSLTTKATNCAVTCKDSIFMLTSDKCFDALSLTSVRLNSQNCQTDTLKVVVNDFIPNNGSIIDGSSPIGGWVYTIQNTRNIVLCSGKLHNIDTISTKTFAVSWGYLSEFVNNQGNAVVNLPCNRVSEVLNKNNSVIFKMDSLTALKTTLENKYYVGVPMINLLCDSVKITKTDILVSSACDSTFITRKYVIENNLGEDTTLTQIIRFLRPTNSKSKSNNLYNEISLGNFGPMSDGFKDSLVNGLPVKNLTSNNRKYRTGVDTIEISTCDKPINKSDFLPYLKSLYKVVFENKIRSKSTRLYDGYKSNLDTLSLFESLNYSICNYNTDFTFQIQTNNSLKTDYQIVAQVFDWCTSTEIKDTIILSFLNKPIIDIDGNCYDTVHIGSQIWMKENLKVTKYRDGSPINTGLDNSAWSSTQTGAYSIYNNDNLNDKKFGKLYNWYAVNDVRGLCPTGWHVPNDSDWSNLKEHLGGDTIAGKALKSLDGWILTSFRGNNQSGFTGLPGGSRNENGIYENSGFGGYFWGSTEAGPNFAWTHGIYASTFLIGRFNNAKSNGRSVRCIEDNSSPIVSTTAASSILATSAETGGNVTSDGGATVTERGVVYATSGIPSLSNSKVVAGTTGTGTFTVNLTGLTGSTKYFFRAYATNSAGTGFGSLDSFITLTPAVLPTISTISLSGITTSSATTGGNVTSDGGATVSKRGVVWSTSPTPTISLSTKTSNGTGTGNFTSSITGLSPNTTYYVRAYATNSAGTVYGNELTFNA
ncbi:MAG: fibrobacter succinogenes major paralogous domain-containing protein, partial [Saprospiraceae bacterium]